MFIMDSIAQMFVASFGFALFVTIIAGIYVNSGDKLDD